MSRQNLTIKRQVILIFVFVISGVELPPRVVHDDGYPDESRAAARGSPRRRVRQRRRQDGAHVGSGGAHVGRRPSDNVGPPVSRIKHRFSTSFVWKTPSTLFREPVLSSTIWVFYARTRGLCDHFYLCVSMQKVTYYSSDKNMGYKEILNHTRSVVVSLLFSIYFCSNITFRPILIAYFDLRLPLF